MADIRDRLPDERLPEAHIGLQTFFEQGPKAGQPAAGSTKVGFTLRDGHNNIVDAMAFLINPQGLDRAIGSRSTLFGTKTAWIVDNFGQAPTTIQMRQLVASGKDLGRDGLFYTAREDIQRFLKNIYLPAINEAGPPRKVFFHDHHLERGFEEQVWFPPDSLNIGRAVDLHNVWRLDLTMVSLEKHPFNELAVHLTSDRPVPQRYTVKVGDSLTSIVTRMAGKHAPSVVRQLAQARLLALNPQLTKKRRKPGAAAGTKTAQPLKVYPGEVLVLGSSS